MFKVLNVLSALRTGFSFLCEKIQSGEHNRSPRCRKYVRCEEYEEQLQEREFSLLGQKVQRVSPSQPWLC